MDVLWTIITVVGGACFIAFVFVIAFGAPYLPTLGPQVTQAMELADLKPGETLLELGSGDGRVLVAAAKRGYNAVGYELNPLLVLYSRARTRKYKGQVRVVWGNFWKQKLPPAEAVFVFLLNPYMERLNKKITQEMGKNVKLVSFAFRIPGKKPSKEQNGLFLYRY